MDSERLAAIQRRHDDQKLLTYYGPNTWINDVADLLAEVERLREQVGGLEQLALTIWQRLEDETDVILERDKRRNAYEEGHLDGLLEALADVERAILAGPEAARVARMIAEKRHEETMEAQ